MLRTVLVLNLLLLPFTSHAAFDGPYSPSNWLLEDPGPTDSNQVDLPLFLEHSMDSLTLVSPDCSGGQSECSGPGYEVKYTTMAAADGFISFGFEWSSVDPDGPEYDRLGVWVNDDFFQLIDSGFGGGELAGGLLEGEPNFQSGTAGINVLTGDIFGFGLRSEDSAFGPSTSLIFDFQVQPFGSGVDGPFFPEPNLVPVPAAVWCFLVPLAALVRKRRQVRD